MVETQLVLPKVGDLKPESGMYCLAGDALESFVFKLDSGLVKEECNLGKALDYLHGAKLRELDFMQVRNPDRDTYKLGTYEVKVEANSCHLRILRELIELTCKGVKPLDATWFYYDSDGEKRLFFVVHSGTIVEDCYTFLNEHPLILAGGMGWAESDFGWYGHPGFAEAFERYWYRKFYTETLAGQLCVLSPYEPALFHYVRKTSASEQDSLPELLVWISCVAFSILAAIAFPSLRIYLSALAFVFAIPWADACRRTLKARGSEK